MRKEEGGKSKEDSKEEEQGGRGKGEGGKSQAWCLLTPHIWPDAHLHTRARLSARVDVPPRGSARQTQPASPPASKHAQVRLLVDAPAHLDVDVASPAMCGQ